MARYLDLPLHIVRVTDDDFMHNIAAVTYANDIPLIYHLNSVPFYLVAKLAADDGVKVLLTGEGSDEYFLGYPEYAQAAVREAVRGAKDRLRRLASRLSRRATNLVWPSTEDTWADHLARLVSRFERELVADEVSSVYEASTGEEHTPRAHLQTMSLALDHLLSLLHRNDRLGMAWSLESRFPFLANEVAQFAINLPGSYKLRPSLRLHDAKHPFVVDKWCVRAVGSQLLPAEFANRQKKGFPVSVYHRLTIHPGFFSGGFVAEHFRLSDAALRRASPERPENGSCDSSSSMSGAGCSSEPRHRRTSRCTSRSTQRETRPERRAAWASSTCSAPFTHGLADAVPVRAMVRRQACGTAADVTARNFRPEGS